MQQSLFWFSLAKTKGPAMTWLAGWANNGPAFSADLGTEQGWEVIREMQSISLTLSTSRSADMEHGPWPKFSSWVQEPTSSQNERLLFGGQFLQFDMEVTGLTSRIYNSFTSALFPELQEVTKEDTHFMKTWGRFQILSSTFMFPFFALLSDTRAS